MATSREYWRRREAEALKHYIRDEREYDKRLAQIYQNMLDSCQKEIDSFYGRYAAAEGITIAEAKKRISKADIAAFERKAARYVKEKNFSKKANEEMRLYNATMRINRLEMLKANIGLELIAGHEEIDKFMAGILKGRTEDELKRQAGILGKTVRGNAAKANAIVNASFHNATFSDRIWQYQDLLRADVGKLLQSGLIQGKNPRVLARELRKTFDTSTYNSERLMRTELARVQTEAQKQSFINNGFDMYEFIVNSGCCDVCKALDGKHFKVAKMMPGENAPPVHPHCRCSVAAWENSEEYNNWLDHLEAGGTTESWETRKHGNLAKAIDSMVLQTSGDKAIYTREEILEEMQKSPVGKDTIRAIRDLPVRIGIYDSPRYDGARGDQQGNDIRVFSQNNKSVRVAGQTLIHEMAHYRFHIGGCQHAESVCFAMEKMHIMGRDYLTESEWEYVKRLAIDNYPEYDWEQGGYGDYDQFSFVKPDE